MAARHLGIDITNVAVDTNAEPATLVDNNPLGKIPVLLLDDGGSVYDSVAIMHYLDRLSGGKLYPKRTASAPKRKFWKRSATASWIACWPSFTSAVPARKTEFTSHGSTSSGKRR